MTIQRSIDFNDSWTGDIEPLLKQFGKRKHPLEYHNRYQLVVMIILSAQDSDKHINLLAASFFEVYPNMESLAEATIGDLYPYLGTVRNFENKSQWLISLARIVKTDSQIPLTMAELIALPGIGRKSANVIIRESGGKAEGIIVDLHVVRVAPRIGIASGSKPEKIESQLMKIVPQDRWNEVGMAISFLGREICRPSHPKCNLCLVKVACEYGKSCN